MDKGQEDKKVATSKTQKNPSWSPRDAVICKGCRQIHYFQSMRLDDFRFPEDDFSTVEVFCRNVTDGSYGSYGKWFSYKNPEEIMTSTPEKSSLELRVKTLENKIQELRGFNEQFTQLKTKVELLTSGYTQELDKSKTELKEFLAEELPRQFEALAKKKKWSTPVQ